MRSNWPGGASYQEARQEHAREEHRRELAERDEREGWGQEPGLPVPAVEVEHDPDYPFCECETCRAKGGSAS